MRLAASNTGAALLWRLSPLSLSLGRRFDCRFRVVHRFVMDTAHCCAPFRRRCICFIRQAALLGTGAVQTREAATPGVYRLSGGYSRLLPILVARRSRCL